MFGPISGFFDLATGRSNAQPAVWFDFMTISPCAISWADVQWRSDGSPYSPDYGDIYYSAAGGLAEKKAVFLEGCALPARFAAGTPTHVLELGFGTGLSFLTTWAAFLQLAPEPNPTRGFKPDLFFFSIEKHPWSRANFLKMATQWPELAALAVELAEQWPDPVPGFHRRFLSHGRVVLTLVFGDVDWALKQLQAPFHAFYLDGFSLRLNDAMWSPHVFRALARLAADEARVATYSSANAVAEGLTAAGFLVEKVPGFGLKKHRLVATRRPMMRSRKPHRHKPPASVVVIGAGIAGLTTAYALARRQVDVTVIDAAATLGEGASGNPAGILSPLLSRDCHAATRLTQMGLGFARQQIKQLQQAGFSVPAAFDGVVQLARDSIHAQRQQQIADEQSYAPEFAQWLDSSILSGKLGIEVTEPGWLFPSAGWVSPHDWLVALQAHSGISLRMNTEVADLSFENGFWRGYSVSGEEVFSSSWVVLANAGAVSSLLPEFASVLTACRGQVDWIDRSDCLGLKDAYAQMPLMREGYILDLPDGRRLFGASFKPGDQDLAWRVEERMENQERLAALSTDLVTPTIQDDAEHQGRVSLRATSRDRLPIVGEMPGQSGLMVNTGHGSRGLTWCPLLAEVLAASCCGEPNPVPRSLQLALRPERLIQE
ncbi:MAG: hypothetical protein B7X37_00565 [Halothiobacillus sp. 14-55-98]|nr:MAG: hypothetical protein B7X37_00565 [Halothiobacillus sp. 14-55-98]